MATPGPAPRFEKGPPPDLSARFKLKFKYAELQRKYARALAMRKDLTLEVAEKGAKVQRLQDEVDMVVDQIYATDYAHLEPEKDDLFSDSDEWESDDPRAPSSAKGKGKQRERDDSDDDNESLSPVGANGAASAAANGNGTNGHAGSPSPNGAGANGKVRKERSYSPSGAHEADSPAHKRARLDGTETANAATAPAPTNGHATGP